MHFSRKNKTGWVKRILLISHEAGLTGAPILLLPLLDVLKSEYQFNIILKKGGVLEGEFRKISPVFVLKASTYSSPKPFFFKLKDRASYFLMQCRVLPLFYQCDLIFSNTIANGRLLNRFRFFRKPIITYVHELASILTFFSKKGDTQYSIEISQFILFPSEAVRTTLVNSFGISSKKMIYLPYYFPSEKFYFDEKVKSEFRKSFRRKWNLSEDVKLVAGMGSVSRRKGTDRFIEIAEKVIDMDEKVCFCWIGDFDYDEFSNQIRVKYFENRINSRLIFTGQLPYSSHTLLPFDLFFLSSVEDPYPLVVLEASFLRVPTICFGNSGGSTELIKNGAGFILDNVSLDKAAEILFYLLQDRKILEEVGLKAYHRVVEKHSNKVVVKQIFSEIFKDLENGNKNDQ